MTQLREEGWLHHLARHAVACFLTRGDLWQSWEKGAAVFDELLLDADPALNYGRAPPPPAPASAPHDPTATQPSCAFAQQLDVALVLRLLPPVLPLLLARRVPAEVRQERRVRAQVRA